MVQYRRNTSAMSKRTTDITVVQAHAEDAAELFAVASEAFGTWEPAWAAFFNSHWTEKGRKLGAERYVAAMKKNDHAMYHKAVDTSTGKVVGFSIWGVFKNRNLEEISDTSPNSYWENTEDAKYARTIMSNILKRRQGFVEACGRNAVHLNTLAVLPEYQGMGIGRKLMAWGVEQADVLGFPSWVEASVPGRPLYEKYGFVVVKDLTLNLENFNREPFTYAWMIRPATKVAEELKGSR